MKKIIFVVMVSIGCGAGAQNVVEKDTIANVSDAKNVVITSVDDGVRIEIEEAGQKRDYVYSFKQESKQKDRIEVTRDWKLRLPFNQSDTLTEKSKESEWAVVSGSFYLGFNNTFDETISERTTASMEIAWDKIIGLQYKPCGKGFSLSLGLGVGWKNFGMESSNLYFAGDRDYVYIAKYDGSKIPNSSSLKVFSFRVPLMLNQELGRGFRIGAGAIMNMNTYASIKHKYIDDYKTVEETFSGAPVKKITWDVMGTVSWKCLGLYVKYSPQTLFKVDKGPQFKTFSLGFGLFM